SRVSLIVGFAAMLVGGSLGIALGVTAGYVGGRCDDVVMALADMQLAFPTILLAITIIAVFGPSFANLVVVIGISGWVTYGPHVRGAGTEPAGKGIYRGHRRPGWGATAHHLPPYSAQHPLAVDCHRDPRSGAHHHS